MESEWIESFERNPIVQATPKSERHKIYPIVIYMDSTPIPPAKDDSIVALSVYSVLTGVRHLVACLRKSEMCQCGCVGNWCSMYPVFVFLHWCLYACATGLFPENRHDQKPWQLNDEYRKSMAGESLGFIAVVVDIKGDWAEFANRWGFPNWRHLIAPCIFCNVLYDNLRTIKLLADGSRPFVIHSDVDYEEASWPNISYVVLLGTTAFNLHTKMLDIDGHVSFCYIGLGLGFKHFWYKRIHIYIYIYIVLIISHMLEI